LVDYLLVMAGARIDQVDQSGWTALHYAAIFGKSSSVRVLFSLGAAPNIADFTGKTAFHLARSDVTDQIRQYEVSLIFRKVIMAIKADNQPNYLLLLPAEIREEVFRFIASSVT